ncbi:P-loop containing nucleoside triphosphate hydrolase protein [Xylaria arbuscula]|nr:P-loop containing nucleoside triphosphate hydrolase protein [Xylaria arbuscula]
MALELLDSFHNANSGHHEALNQLQEQIQQMKNNNGEISLALANTTKATSSDQDNEFGLRSVDTLGSEVGHWKHAVEELSSAVETQKEIISSQEAEIAQHQEDNRALMVRYRNVVEELAAAKGNIRIMCRIRPVGEVADEDLIKLINPDNPEGGESFFPWTDLRATYLDESKRTENREFKFQRVFAGDDNNETIFNEVKDFAQSAALGSSCTIMAYGATGTGKSHTFLSDDGLVNSFVRLLFQLADAEIGQYEYEFQMSAVEIYLNKVLDLLQTADDGGKVEVKLTTESSMKLWTEEEAVQSIKQAIDRREAASTRQNNSSSRSHFAISIRIVRKSKIDGTETTGTASFVDLAGSEAVGRNLLAGTASAQQSLQYEQGQDINKSLLDLGQNIRGIATGNKFFPGHNLTRFLRASLSEGSKLLVIATVSPLAAHQTNTLSTLRWATDAVGTPAGRPTGPRTPPRSSKLPVAPGTQTTQDVRRRTPSKITSPSRASRSSNSAQGKSRP